MITFTIPLKVTNPLNGSQGRSRAAMFGKAARRKKERGDSMVCCQQALRISTPAFLLLRTSGTVTITRLSPGKLDGDGLQAALKSVRDGVADALGINDGSDAVVWRYDQRKCKRGQFGVEVSIG